MMMTTDRERQRLLSAWRQLDAEDRRNVRLFAEFLVQRQTACDEVAHPPPSEPLPIAKPDGETAVKALKRLKKTYPMIETDLTLLEQASQVLMQKVMGSADVEVISRLEALFSDRYKLWKSDLQ